MYRLLELGMVHGFRQGLHVQVHGFRHGPTYTGCWIQAWSMDSGMDYIYRCMDLGMDLHIQVHGFRLGPTYTGA